MTRLAVALALILAGCSGGTPAPPSPDLSAYLIQTSPLRRWDGQDQFSASFADPRGFYVTTWAYGPGPFNAARGDGGEVETSDGTTVRIVATQDGSKPGITRFGALWWLYDNQTPDCAVGWRNSPDGLGRACHALMTFPATGGGLPQIAADTIISEHYDLPGRLGNMERFYMAAGWGRLCWLSVNANAPRGGMAQSCGTGDPPLPAPASDRRLVTHLLPPDGSTPIAWPPAGFVP